MINPNENNLTRDEPLPTPVQPDEEQISSGRREQFRQVTNKFSTAVSHTWDETKEKASRARERTEYFVRENPVPTILGALGLGIAIGLAIRFASTSEEGRRSRQSHHWQIWIGAFSRCRFCGHCSNQPEKSMRSPRKR